ncbi:MAG: general secretion pathway protein GspD [Burkholderiales bacterium]|nr:general secretion pathway protein GspD [Burkholderiales bacterium]
MLTLQLCSYSIVGSLLGCAAGTQDFREGKQLISQGKVESGLAKLEAALQKEPRNAEYKAAYSQQKMTMIQRLLSQGDRALAQQQVAQAEQYYSQVLTLEENNIAAQSGLDSVKLERRHQKQMEQAQAIWKKGGKNAALDALEIVRTVLNENPKQKQALQLRSQIRDTQGNNDGKLAQSFRKLITLEFRDAPLRSVFDVVSRQSGLNFYFDKEVRPDLRTTILVRQTSIEEAVRMLLATNQLEMAVMNDNSIMVYPNSPQKIKDYQQLNVRTFFLANGDVKTVAYTIKTLLKARDIVTDERLGLIIMRDTPEMLRMAERIIAVQDLSDPEVMLEVEVLEVKRSRLMELGVRWPESASLSLAGINKGTGTTNQLLLEDLRNINRGNINLDLGKTTINARKEDSDSNILANPRIRVKNKEKAKFMIGDRVPVITTTSTSTGFVADSVSYVDVGIKLDVEPNIYLDDEVSIKMTLEVSNLVKEVTSKSGTQAYQIGTRNATTVLRLRDGETQILAGLISDEERSTANKVPGIGELPVLNRIFGSSNDTKDRSEIVLSITPHLIRAIRRPDLSEAEFPSGSENRVGQTPSFSGGSSDAGSGRNDSSGAMPMMAPRRSPMVGGSDDDSNQQPPMPIDSMPAGIPPTPQASNTTPEVEKPSAPQEAPLKPGRKPSPAGPDKK